MIGPIGLTRLLLLLRKATLTPDCSNRPAGQLQILKRVSRTTGGLDIRSFLLPRDDLRRMRGSADLELSSRDAVMVGSP